MVRDERGNPISADNAQVIFHTASGMKLSNGIHAGLGAGINYRLAIPMDAGLTADAYLPTAMRPTMPFTIQVKVGNTVYLPIEMKSSGSMGQPGERTRLDLTLGEDSDGDGLPDAWERSLINRGFGDSLADINPNDDADGDGLSNLQEYISGNYAFDSENGFSLEIVRIEGNAPVVQFLAVNGRNYRVYGSGNLDGWTAVPFRLASDDAETADRESYRSEDVETMEIVISPAANGSQYRFFRLMVE